MKFLVSKDIYANQNFTLLLGFYSLMMLLYFLGDLFYLFNFFGTSVPEVLSTLKGDADNFIEPLSLLSLLEHLHISLFLAILALFTTMAIILRMKLTHIHKQIIIIFSMSALLLSFICLISTYFLHNIFVYGMIAFELAWHLLGTYALSIVIYQVWIKKQ